MFTKKTVTKIVLFALLGLALVFGWKLCNPEVMTLEQSLDCDGLRCTIVIENNHDVAVPFDVEVLREAQGTPIQFTTESKKPSILFRNFSSLYRNSGVVLPGEVKNIYITVPLQASLQKGQILLWSKVIGIGNKWFNTNGVTSAYFAMGEQKGDGIKFRMQCGPSFMSVTIENKSYVRNTFALYVNNNLDVPWQIIEVNIDEIAKLTFDYLPEGTYLLEIDAVGHHSSESTYRSEYHPDRSYCIPGQLYHPSTTP